MLIPVDAHGQIRNAYEAVKAGDYGSAEAALKRALQQIEKEGEVVKDRKGHE